MGSQKVPIKSKYIEHNIIHYQQCFNWDCGIACVMMLLPTEQRDYLRKHFTKICLDEGFLQSTWTIDLCYLLKRFGIEHCMYTIVKAVNSRRAINDGIDYQACKRVENRILNAEEAGICIKEKELTVKEILSHVECKGPAIVLVDSPLLICDLCKHNKMKAEFRRAFGGRYKGHYILVVGHSGNKVLYRDPALSARLCATSLARLHAARRAPGTDFDVILVNKDLRRCLI
ncbi:PREDICTED: protein GUCD1 isoform X5 [Papilio polytes]|uniref:protein GUCD1 isoform X5 n=1 Tax=Papilio polytes TaxID=76194 RepID=UPI00067644F1|nr:PREDICTED: protein GUCD1 isoform X5 [Papilio polytes]